MRLLWLFVFVMCISCGCWHQIPIEVTACQLKANPSAYDHKIVRVSGFASHGYEDFTLFDPSCPSWPGIWLEYGGTVNSETIYLGGGKPERTRATSLAVEGTNVPLKVNKQFEEFDKAIQPPFRSKGQGAVIRATFVGRFFAGKRLELFEGKPWGGYGHMGCCTLLAIQEVKGSDTQNRPLLDYGSSPDQPDLAGDGCGFRGLLPLDQAGLLEWQRQADRGEHSWAFVDPERTAREALSRGASVDMALIKDLQLVKETQGRKVYEGRPKSKRASYMVVVSRPYWLWSYARDASRVAWAAIAAYESSCGGGEVY